jgi:hypothetical protein
MPTTAGTPLVPRRVAAREAPRCNRIVRAADHPCEPDANITATTRTRGSHLLVESRRLAALSCPRRPLRTRASVFGSRDGKEGSTVRVRQRACLKALQGAYYVACDGEISRLRGYETGTFGTSGTRDVSRHGAGLGRLTRWRPSSQEVPKKERLLLPELARRRALPSLGSASRDS